MPLFRKRFRDSLRRPIFSLRKRANIGAAASAVPVDWDGAQAGSAVKDGISMIGDLNLLPIRTIVILTGSAKWDDAARHIPFTGACIENGRAHRSLGYANA